MHLLLAGGTGFVGQELTRYFLNQGHAVTTLGRSRAHPCEGQHRFHHIAADTTREGPWQDAVGRCQAVINLAGGTIFRRWTVKAKQDIRDSRILTTRHLVQAFPANPNTFLFNASGAGYYGDCGDQSLNENTAAGDDFLARLSIDWEKEALQAESRGVRVAIGRFGVILHQTGGALPKMLPAFRMGVGGPLGNGRQWFPWIHLDDVIAAIDFLLIDQTARGPFNFCAPEPVTNRQFARGLGRTLKRPSFFPAPGPLMRLLLGEFSGVLLGSQRARPKRLLDGGFAFRYPTLELALEAIIKARSTA